MKPDYEEDAFCEHCMNLEPFTMTFDLGGVSYCESCAITNDEIKEVKPQWLEKQRKLQIKYYQAKLDKLRAE